MKKIICAISLILLMVPLASANANVNAEFADQDTGVVSFGYKIRSGDTLWSIAKKFNLDLAVILNSNPNLKNKDKIIVGDILHIPKASYHTVKSGESLWSISKKYNVTLKELIKRNNLSDPNLIKAGTKVLIPKQKQNIAKGSTISYNKSSYVKKIKRFIWPTRYRRITSPFGVRWGKFHKGIDIAAPEGSVIRAARTGRVIISRYIYGYGNAIYIDHGSGISTRYAHNSRLLVTEGDIVKQGQIIAYSGNTGRSTGPHLHFEIRINHKAVNALSYLD